MAHTRTNVSLPADLFNRGESARRKMNLSRSSLYALALTEFLLRRENMRLAAQIDDAYSDGLDEEEQAWLRFGAAQLFRFVAAEDEP